LQLASKPAPPAHPHANLPRTPILSSALGNVSKAAQPHIPLTPLALQPARWPAVMPMAASQGSIQIIRADGVGGRRTHWRTLQQLGVH